MNPYLAWARIILRYGIGAVAGLTVGEQIAADQDLVLVVSGGLAMAVEAFYEFARRRQNRRGVNP